MFSFGGAMQTDESILEKGRELFALCDQEGKGFITRSDLARLDRELPLTGDQLAAAFDGLDEDGNGYLTLNEFLEGFAEYLSVRKEEVKKKEFKNTNPFLRVDDDNFEGLLDHLGAKNIFKDEEMIKAIWSHLKRQDDSLLLEFEKFLGKISMELKRNLNDTDTLQSVLENKTSAYENQIRKMYDEMENQIRVEKERILYEERQKEKRIREELETQLRLKDQQLQDLLAKQSEMQQRLEGLNSVEIEAKQTSDRLFKEKETLESQLTISQQAITELQKNLEFVRRQGKEEKRQRVKSALNISESIALEREELVKQLDLLKTINKQLQDEKDENMEQMSHTQSLDGFEKVPSGEILLFSPADSGLASSHDSSGSRRVKRGSVMSDYVTNNRLPRANPLMGSANEVFESDGANESSSPRNDPLLTENETNLSSFGKNGNGYRYLPKPEPDPILGVVNSVSVNPLMEEFLSSQAVDSMSSTVEEEEEEELWNIESHAKNCQNQRKPIVPKSQCNVPKTIGDPQRVFKVVFIGDSGVGKSSFIHRFCNNTFRATFSTTIGVDFQIKHVECDGQTVVMQLWDTAGQERFRSITHQYMRKADGVVIVYDVTSETSFKNVRNWMTCVRSTAEEDTVILLIGNKTDMCTSSNQRAVKTNDGLRLAEECFGLFFETSVKENIGVETSMTELARRLREKQDLQLEKSLQLHLNAKKKRCC